MTEEPRRPVLQSTPSSLAPQPLPTQPNPPEAPNPLETQISPPPEVVPGGGRHHEQPGLEVVQKPDSGYANIVPESPYAGGISKLPPEYESLEKEGKGERRICGIKRWIFLTVLAIVLVIAIAGGVVGGVLGSRASRNDNGSPDDTTAPPLPTTTTNPIAIAAVKGQGDNKDTTVIRQDNNTEQLFMHVFTAGRWSEETVLIEGLDPPPSKNVTFTAIQFPKSTNIQIFYAAENGTIFDASGTSSNGNWKMGSLASDTGYTVAASLGSGLAASPFMPPNKEEEYAARVYYVDRDTQYVQELLYDRGGRWSLTQTRFSRASAKGKIAVAWVQAANFSYTDNQVMHVFYQDSRSNLVHVPGYDGQWDFEEHSETLGTLIDGTHLAAHVLQNTAESNNTMRIMWINRALHLTLLRGRGASIIEVDGFEPKGTFSNPIDIVTLDGTRNLAIAGTGGGSLSVVPHEESFNRLYYQSLQDQEKIVETGMDRYWFTLGLIS